MSLAAIRITLPCRENQKGTPTGVYGKTKLEGEQNIEVVDCDYVIIRTAWLYSEYGRNFVKTMLNLTATKPKLTVVFDQAGTPTYAYDLAVAIKTYCQTMKKRIQRTDIQSAASTISATRVYARGSTLPRRLPNSQEIQPATSNLATAMSSPVRSTSGIFGIGQDKNQGDFRVEDTLLDGFAESLHENMDAIQH